jgi:hypothetical protein
MIAKIMQWVSITALFFLVTWSLFAYYRMDFVVCAGAFTVVLALFFIKGEIETHANPTPQEWSPVSVKVHPRRP